jgi:DNA-binding response OmpR family regulator
MSQILIVDDDESFRKMLRLTLEKLGHKVVEAKNGREGMKLYAQTPADLVMMDLIMPDQEGLQTIREMRHAHPKQKIVAMSGGGRLNTPNYLKIASMMGVDGVLTKPFAPEELAAMLAGLKDLAGEPAKAPAAGKKS